MKINRIQITLGVFLLLAQPRSGLTGENKFSQIDVAIIGGGLSGLTTAYRLGALSKELETYGVKLKLDIYEARKRLGGRVFTVTMGNKPIEMGGQSLEDGGDAKEIRQLIHDMGLGTTVFQRPSRSYFLHESHENNALSKTKLFRIYDELMPEIHRISTEEEKKSLHSLLEQLEKKHDTLEGVISEFFEIKKKTSLSEGNPKGARAYEILKDYYRARIMTYESLPVSELAPSYATGSFLRFFQDMEDEYQRILQARKENSKAGETAPYKTSSVAGGNGKLIAALGQKVLSAGTTIHLSTPLSELIKESDSSYTLVFTDGKKTHAKIVVLTLPATLYSKIHFINNAIPINQLKEIERVKYGPVGKIQIPVQDKNPDEMIGAVFTADMLTWFNRDFERDHHHQNSVMTLYTTGNSAILKEPFDRLGKSEKSSEYTPKSLADQRLAVGLFAVKSAYPNLSFEGTKNTLKVQVPTEEQFSTYSKQVGVNWATEKYSLGGYSVVSAEQAHIFSDDQIETVLGQPVYKIFKPVLTKEGSESCTYCGIYFAGEHTATQGTPATMEGAVHSGNKVAYQIRQRMKNLHQEHTESTSVEVLLETSAAQK